MKNNFLFITFIFIVHFGFGQCANSSNIYSFVYNGKTYEVVKENKSWVNAATCAVSRGGILAEINDLAEQNAIYNELNTNANITTNNTVAPDGGGASYVWIGGNDIGTEGNWIWDGNNNNSGAQFWLGTASGSPVGGLYNNWGNEPDNFGTGQDGLGLALTNWPFGVASQWNDLDASNSLYYVIEYSTILGVNDKLLNESITIFPNPAKDFIRIQTANSKIANVTVLDASGKTIKSENGNNTTSLKIELSAFPKGVYLVKITTIEGRTVIKKFVK